eukprot:g7928.t1
MNPTCCCVTKTRVTRRVSYIPRSASRAFYKARKRHSSNKDSQKKHSYSLSKNHRNESALKATRTGVGLAKDIYCAQPWWSRNLTKNTINVNSPDQMLHALSTAGNKLVVIDFYAKWCRSCRALHPKLAQICAGNPNVVLLKVNWDDNIDLCKVMGVQVLPFFHLYRRPFGRQASFTSSVSRIGKLRDAIKLYGVPLEGSKDDYPGTEDVNSIDLYLDEDLKSVSGQLEKLKIMFSTH